MQAELTQGTVAGAERVEIGLCCRGVGTAQSETAQPVTRGVGEDRTMSRRQMHLQVKLVHNEG